MDDQPRLTEEQESALSTRDVSVALSAGAGCGKTFVLTQRFLSHLEPGASDDPLGKLVAITFTERAAREMRDRIRAACREQLQHCPDELVPGWLRILRGLDSARISTIHSFCGSLLRAHAVDAGLDPEFGVLDAASSGLLLDRAVKGSLFDLLARQDDEAMEIVLRYGLERGRDMIRSMVWSRFSVDDERFREWTPDRLSQSWMDCWREVVIPRMVQELGESQAATELLEFLQTAEPSDVTMQDRRSVLLEQLPRLGRSKTPLELLKSLREAAQVRGGGGKRAWPSEDAYATVQALFKKFRAEADKRLKLEAPDAQDAGEAARLGLAAYQLAQAAGLEYAALKQAAGCLDFDDLLLRARDLLRDSPRVRRQAAEGIELLMVDEFQDTDVVQAKIVELLCGEELTDGRLFLVGDVKQSIYRFRRADPRVFTELRCKLPERGRLPLNTNFRSQPAILNFVNAVFAPTMEDYEPLVPFETEQLSPTPAIEFLFAYPQPEELPAAESENAAGRRQREAEWIARRIRELLDDPTLRIRRPVASLPPANALRPVQKRDITILFRSLSNVSLYEDSLRRQGVDYYLVGGRAFFAQQEIYDLANLCQWLCDADDEVSLLGVLRSPLFGLSDDTVFALVQSAGTLGAALSATGSASATRLPADLPEIQHHLAEHAQSVLSELRGNKDRLPLARLLNLAVERTGYDAALLHEYLGERKLANLRKLIEMAREFDRTPEFTLQEFVGRLRQSITEQTEEALAATHPEAADVVRLMTIHQAKGLEFPVVIIADMDWGRRGGRSAARVNQELGPLVPLPPRQGETPPSLGMQVHRELENWEDRREAERLLYVAMTRAKDHLILSAGLGADRRPKNEWLKLLSQRFDLRTGLPVGDPYLGRTSLGDVARRDIPEIRVHHTPPATPVAAARPRDGRVPLGQFRERVEQADRAELPASVRPIPPAWNAVRQFSVSRIEEMDEQSKETVHGDAARDTAETDAAARQFQEATDMGTLVHAVLERVDFREPASIEPLLRSCAESLGTTSEAVLDAAGVRLRAFAASTLPAELAALERCEREIDFLLRWPIGVTGPSASTVIGQIDLLGETSEGDWRLFDYKTGRGHSRSDAELLAKYELQLVLYALAVREFTGRLPGQVELIVLEEELDRIRLQITDELIARISDRVDSAIERLKQGALVTEGMSESYAVR